MVPRAVQRRYARMDVRTRVGRNLQKLRRDSGLTQEELAHKAEVHQTYLSGVERGKRNASILVLERIVGALGADIARPFDE
jgi:transcriptional regulator with XRE-family HTH domain